MRSGVIVDEVTLEERAAVYQKKRNKICFQKYV
jgi:hypothetical protein